MKKNIAIMVLIICVWSLKSYSKTYYYKSLEGIVNSENKTIFFENDSVSNGVVINGLSDILISSDYEGTVIQDITLVANEGVDLSEITLSENITSGDILSDDDIVLTKNSNSSYTLTVSVPEVFELGNMKVKFQALSNSKQEAYSYIDITFGGDCDNVNPLSNIEQSGTTYLIGGSEGNSSLAKEELICISNYQTEDVLNANYKLMSDVSFDGSNEDWDIVGDNDALGWKPIGKSIPNFRGIFNGNNKTIKNIYINTNTDNAGFIGRISGGSISYLNIENAEVTGTTHSSILVGYAINSSEIKNCHVNGDVVGTRISGLITGGLDSGSILENSSSSGSILGTDIVGGIMGGSDRTSIASNNYSSADVSGSNYVGGISGATYYQSHIYSSYATGNVSGANYVGGLVGLLSSASFSLSEISPSNIYSSYATGHISGTSYVGGLVGILEGGNIYSSYANWYLEPTSTSSYVGGLVGGFISGSINNESDLCENVGKDSLASLDGTYTCSASGNNEDVYSIQTSASDTSHAWSSSDWIGIGTDTTPKLVGISGQ